MKPSDHSDLEETLRALDVLRERKANVAYYGRINRSLLAVLLLLPAVVLIVIVVSGVFAGEFTLWPIVIGVGYVGLLYAITRALYPKNAETSDFLLGHIGFRRSASEILDEQIVDYEERLNSLRREGQG